MKTLLCAITVLLLLFASMMFWMAEFVIKGLTTSSASPTRYFIAGILFGCVAAAALRGAVD